MSLQYPHFLFMVEEPDAWENPERDNDGNWIEQHPIEVYVSSCREVKDGKGSAVMGTDGIKQVYSSTIMVPVSCPDIPYGTIVFVKHSEEATSERVRGSIKLFDRGQFSSRIYV